jgi:hypothetical protein
MQSAQKDFFVSYNSADVFWGEWIAWQLEQAGFSVSIQAWDFRPGQDFVLGMQEAVQAKHTIAVLSENYLRADFTQPEWSAAFVRDPRGVKRTLIPVLVRPCKLEGFFATRIYIDFTDLEEKDGDIARKRLIDGVSLDRVKPQETPAFPGKKGKANEALLPEHSSLSSEPTVFPKNIPPMTRTIEIFTVFATEDKVHLTSLEKQLVMLKQQGWISTWNSGQILPGHEIAPEIEAHWNASQLILLLISSDSLNGSYEVINRAMNRHKAGTARVIPIILRPCLWDFDTLAVLPTNKKAITSWSNRDEAFTDVAMGIRDAVKELLLLD